MRKLEGEKEGGREGGDVGNEPQRRRMKKSAGERRCPSRTVLQGIVCANKALVCCSCEAVGLEGLTGFTNPCTQNASTRQKSNDGWFLGNLEADVFITIVLVIFKKRARKITERP